MAEKQNPITPSVELSAYRDQLFRGSRQEQEIILRQSSTLYVGNLSFFTTEEQIYELFSRCGEIKRVIMGLDKFKKTPCGFCFVEYYTRSKAENAMRYVSGTRLDDRIIRVDWDTGFVEGRQYGRGKSGCQVRDECRTNYDAGRDGYGKIMQQRMNMPDSSTNSFFNILNRDKSQKYKKLKDKKQNNKKQKGKKKKEKKQD